MLDVTAGGQGVVKCRDWMDIKPEIRGIVREIAVKEGQWVITGMASGGKTSQSSKDNMRNMLRMMR